MAKDNINKRNKGLSDLLDSWNGKSNLQVANEELASMERACLTLPMFLQAKTTAIIEKHKKDKVKFIADRKAKIESILAGRIK